jgi:hypothetical protein
VDSRERKLVRSIYKKYIARDSAYELNINDDKRLVIEQALAERQETLEILDAVKEEVCYLIHTNNMGNFKFGHQ